MDYVFPEQEGVPVKRFFQEDYSQSMREDLAQLAGDLPPLSDSTSEQNLAETNKSLAAGLDRLRGEAIQKAKQTNTRLRRSAIIGAAVSLGVGASLGYFLSARRIPHAELCI